MAAEEDEVRCLRIRGLPWATTKEDISAFFNDCKIYKGLEGVHLMKTPNGKLTGEAYVEVPPGDDIDVWLRKNKKSMGHRYIEVFTAKRMEMEWAVKKNRSADDSDSTDDKQEEDNSEDCECYVRLRGLPYECAKEDIEHFFEGLELASNGIHLMTDGDRPTGEGYVQFANAEQADKARGRDRQCIGPRYIELFRVSPTDLRNMRDRDRHSRSYGRGYYDRPHPYDRGPRYMDRDRYGGPSPRSSRYSSRGFDDDNFPFDHGPGPGWGGRPSPYSRRGSFRPSGGGARYSGSSSSSSSEKNCLIMRGLPFQTNEYAIKKFFEPVVPTTIDIIYDSSMRPSGSAKISFENRDQVTQAMGKHKDRMEHRYIELFLHK